MPKLTFTGTWRPLGCLLVGILLYDFLGRNFSFAGEVSAFFFVLFLVGFGLAVKRPLARRRRWAGVAALFVLVSLAFLASFLKNTPKTLPASAENIAYFKLTIVEGVAVKPNTVSTVGQLERVRDATGVWLPAQGQVAVTMPRSFEADALQYGDQLLVKGSLSAPPPPANPYQFDYRQFLARRHIQWQVYVGPERWVVTGRNPPSYIRGLSYLVREKLEEKFVQYLPQKRELAIARALVLGVKDDLDVRLRNTYSRTGTMHVLAVSGLHVGTFYVLLLFLLKPLRQRKSGRLLVSLFLISILWFYAFLTGLAPSVLRSVIMFSIVEAGFMFQKRASVMNSLAVAAFVLLLYEPNLLFDVGFQLSFSAVAGIVLLQPILAKQWEPENKFASYFWQLLTLSVAAQLATSPLSLFYFHQFPVYFGVTNLFAVPLATGALYAGILFMVVSPVPALATLAAKVLFGILWCMNALLQWVEQWPRAVLDGFAITPGQVLVMYLLIGATTLFFLRKNLSWLTAMVLCIAFLSGTEVAEASRQRHTRELVLYSVRQSSGMSVINGRQAFLIADSTFYSNPQNFLYNVQPHWWQRGVREEVRFWPSFQKTGQKCTVPNFTTNSGNQLMVWQGKRLLWLKHLPKSLVQPIEVEALVLQQNVWAPVEKLRTSFKTGTIILDQTNSRRYAQRKAEELRGAGYQVHVLEEEGAWRIKLK